MNAMQNTAAREQEYFEANKKLWNSRVEDHAGSDFYGLDSFLQGRNSLNAPELELLGDIKGKKILHLQCHFGQDTLSMTRMGAQCTGVDFSEDAINKGSALAEKLGLDTQFVCCNVYDAPRYLDGKFDIVYTSYGTIGWLPDLDRWAAVVAHFLKPGGFFLIVDFHPVVWMFDGGFDHVIYSYFNDAVIEEEISGSYANRDAETGGKEYGWNHSFSEIFGALKNNGLQTDEFREYAWSPYNVFQGMEESSPGQWTFEKHGRKLPLLYGLKAIKK